MLQLVLQLVVQVAADLLRRALKGLERGQNGVFTEGFHHDSLRFRNQSFVRKTKHRGKSCTTLMTVRHRVSAQPVGLELIT